MSEDKVSEKVNAEFEVLMDSLSGHIEELFKPKKKSENWKQKTYS